MTNPSNPQTNPADVSKPGIKNNNKGCKFWKILTVVLIIIIILLLLTQCESIKNYCSPSEEEKCADDSSKTQDKKVDGDDNNIISNKADECSYLGTWTRTGTYLNDDLVSNTPSTLNLFEDSYHNETDVCFTEGDLSVSGENMTLEIDNTDCQTGSIPTSYTNIYKLDCEGTKPLHLTFIIEQSGSTIREEYDRTN